MESILGWIICGPVQIQETSVQVNQAHTLIADYAYMDPAEAEKSQELKKLWGELSIDVDDEEGVYEQFKRNTKYTGERYDTCLPVKPFHRELPDN